MTISILFVLVFTILLLIWKMENKLTFAFGAGFLSVLMLMIALAMYTIRISNYRYFFMFEFYIIRRLGSINISYYDLKYLVLISVGIFMSLMFYLYTEGIPGKKNFRGNIVPMAAFLRHERTPRRLCRRLRHSAHKGRLRRAQHRCRRQHEQHESGGGISQEQHT